MFNFKKMLSFIFRRNSEDGDSISFEKCGESKSEEYILEDNDGYIDHKEPKRMPNKDILNMPMKREEIETNNLIGIVGNDGKPVNPADLSRQILNQAREGAEFAIPGQIKRDSNGNIIGKNPLPNTIPTLGPGGVRQMPIGSSDREANYQQVQYQPPQQPQYQPIPVHTQSQNNQVLNQSTGPTYSMYTVEDAFYVFIDIPGADRSASEGLLKIKENKIIVLNCPIIDFSEVVTNLEKEKKDIKKKAKVILERKGNRQDKFSWTFGLSRSIVPGKVSASWLDNGVLQLYLPFQEQSESEIQIQVL